MASIRPLAHSACRTQAALDARAGLPVHGHDSVSRNWSRFCARSWAQELLARAIGNLRHLFHRSRKWTQFCVRNLAIKLCPDFLRLFKINSCGQFLATKTWPFSGHKNVSIFSLSEHGFLELCVRAATKPCPIPGQRSRDRQPSQAIQALRRELLLPRPPCPGLPNAPLRLGGDARAAAPNLCASARARARCQRIATPVCTKPHRWQHSRCKSILQATNSVAEARSARIREVARVALIRCITVRFTLPRHDATALGIDCNLALVVNHHMRRTFSVRRTATRPPARDTLTHCNVGRRARVVKRRTVDSHMQLQTAHSRLARAVV